MAAEMQNWQIIISISGVFIGIISGLHAILLANIRKQMERDSKENREDHHQIFSALTLKQSIAACDDRIRICDCNRNKILDSANKASEALLTERRIVVDDKIDGIVTSLDNLSICISKYTKGACP